MLEAFAQPAEAYRALFLGAAGTLVLSVLTLALVKKKDTAAAGGQPEQQGRGLLPAASGQGTRSQLPTTFCLQREVRLPGPAFLTS